MLNATPESIVGFGRKALMHVLITCKCENDFYQKQPRKRDDIIFPILSILDLFKRSRAVKSVVRCPI